MQNNYNFKKRINLEFLIIVFVFISSFLIFSELKNIVLLPMKTIMLPDIESGEIGKGFTVTGLTYDNTHNCFYAGNIGKFSQNNKIFKPSIVCLSSDFQNCYGEIPIYKFFPYVSDIQGITIDETDESLFFCSCIEGKIRHITKDGADISSFSVDEPSGIAYDKNTDKLWVLNKAGIMLFDKIGNQEIFIPFEIKGADQLFLHSSNCLYITAGNDYSKSSNVYMLDLESKKIYFKYKLICSNAVEGICILNNNLIICNDGLYHQAKIPLNLVQVYEWK